MSDGIHYFLIILGCLLACFLSISYYHNFSFAGLYRGSIVLKNWTGISFFFSFLPIFLLPFLCLDSCKQITKERRLASYESIYHEDGWMEKVDRMK